MARHKTLWRDITASTPRITREADFCYPIRNSLQPVCLSRIPRFKTLTEAYNEKILQTGNNHSTPDSRDRSP